MDRPAAESTGAPPPPAGAASPNTSAANPAGQTDIWGDRQTTDLTPDAETQAAIDRALEEWHRESRPGTSDRYPPPEHEPEPTTPWLGSANRLFGEKSPWARELFQKPHNQTSPIPPPFVEKSGMSYADLVGDAITAPGGIHPAAQGMITVLVNELIGAIQAGYNPEKTPAWLRVVRVVGAPAAVLILDRIRQWIGPMTAPRLLRRPPGPPPRPSVDWKWNWWWPDPPKRPPGSIFRKSRLTYRDTIQRETNYLDRKRRRRVRKNYPMYF